MAQMIKILQGGTLEELEANVNAFLKLAEEEPFRVDYLGDVRELGGRFIYTVEYHEYGDREEEEHHG